jgi:hypothetical protein
MLASFLCIIVIRDPRDSESLEGLDEQGRASEGNRLVRNSVNVGLVCNTMSKKFPLELHSSFTAGKDGPLSSAPENRPTPS